MISENNLNYFSYKIFEIYAHTFCIKFLVNHIISVRMAKNECFFHQNTWPFQKWTKINVLFSFPFLLYGKK